MLKNLSALIGILSILTIVSVNVANTKTLRVLKGHDSNVIGLSFSPNGKTLISGSHDNTLRLWDIASGKTIRVFKGHKRSINCVAFSPDGKTAISGSDDSTLRLWNVNGKTIRVFKGHDYSVLSVAFSPDGKRVISGSNDETIRVWDANSGKNLVVFRGLCNLKTSMGSGPSCCFRTVSFSPDGKTALSGSNDDTLRLLNIANGKTIRVFKGHKGSINCVAFSPDGKTALSASDDSTLRLLNIVNGKTIRVFKGHIGLVNCVAFSPDGKTAISGSNDDTLRLWYVSSGETLRVFRGHVRGPNQSVDCVAFSPDGKTVASGAWDDTIRLWDTTSVTTSYDRKIRKEWNRTKKADKVARYRNFVNDYSKNVLFTIHKFFIENAIHAIYKIIQKKNEWELYEKFIKNYPKSPDVPNAIHAIYKIIQKKNKWDDYESFVQKFPNEPDADNALMALCDLAMQHEGIKYLLRFVKIFPDAPQRKRCVKAIYNFVTSKENISGHEWFAQSFPKSVEAKDALQNVYRLLFKKAKSINTVSAYNSFIIACPLAPQARKANKMAYDLERSIYTDFGWLSFIGKAKKKEKNARKLLSNLKIIEFNIYDYDKVDREKTGYTLIVNRMENLLKSEFIDTEATLIRLESDNFKSSKNLYNEAIKAIQSIQKLMAQDAKNFSDLIILQTQTIISHFRESNRNAELSKYRTEKQQEWEKYIYHIGEQKTTSRTFVRKPIIHKEDGIK